MNLRKAPEPRRFDKPLLFIRDERLFIIMPKGYFLEAGNGIDWIIYGRAVVGAHSMSKVDPNVMVWGEPCWNLTNKTGGRSAYLRMREWERERVIKSPKGSSEYAYFLGYL